MASIKERKTKDGKIRYYVQVRLHGQKQCDRFERLTDAKKWIQDTESAIRSGRHFRISEAKKHTLGQMIDRYVENVLPLKEKCLKRQGAQLLWWKEQIGNNLLADITPSLIGEQRDKLLKETTVRKKLRAPATVVRYMAALSHAFSICVKEWGWLEDSPMRKVQKPREPRGRVRYLSTEERVSLLKACKESSNKYLYPIVIVALSTGMRLSEILNLRWTDIDFAKGRIFLEKQKNGERSTIPLAGLALQLLKEYHEQRSVASWLLFPSKEDSNKPIDIRFPWEKALVISGVKNFSFHCLRHSAASYLAMNGCSLIEIQKLQKYICLRAGEEHIVYTS